MRDLLCVLLTVLAAGADSPARADDALTLQPFPSSARNGIDALFAFAAGGGASFAPEAAATLVDFVQEACKTDSAWELPARAGASGSAYIVKVKVPLQQYLALNFHPGIPDYAVFPASLRYSCCLDAHDMQQAYACIATGPTGSQAYATARMAGMEEITPNPESGGYFSYTNSRTFLRCRVGGRDVLFSCAETLNPSTLSNRGALIGSLEQALYYYSEKPGLNITGMTWVLSQINHSSTLSIYIELNAHETAVATFAWLNAGWKGMNVTRAGHILNSQRNTLNFSRRIAQQPGITAPILAALVSTVEHLPVEAVNTEYERYLAYVRQWRDQGEKGLFSRGTLLQDLYDAKITQTLPVAYRRALLVQERVRGLLGMPTWSAVPGPLARR